MRLSCLFFLALGCGGEPDCPSGEAVLSGTITGDGTLVAYLFTTGGDLVAQVTAEADGSYQFRIDGGGDYIVSASAVESTSSDTGGSFGGRSCYSEDVPVKLASCEELTVDLATDECISADKPNLYLYPALSTPTTVTLTHDVRQAVFASDPPYLGGWSGVAHPDGTFTTDGARAPFLFYEISVLPAQYRALPAGEVRCLPGEGAVDAMADLLGEYGFDARERADFVAAWRPDLPARPSYTVRAVREVDAVVGVDIQPPLPLDRVWLVVSDGSACVASAGTPTPITRNVAHAVEWGVILRDLR